MKKRLLSATLILVSFLASAQDFITRWVIPAGQTSISFQSSITLPGASYTWETVPPGNSGSGLITSNSVTITGLPSGSTIRLSISSTNFHRINLYNQPDAALIVDVEQWGAVVWSSMSSSFRGCLNLDVSATDIPNLTGLTVIGGMFAECSSLSGPANINSWNTSTVTDMSVLFYNCTNFNQPLNNWNVSNVTNMSSVFYGAATFNQPLNNWNVSNVTNLSSMFSNASTFNQDISSWNTSSVVDMNSMFFNALVFNHDLSNWNVSNVTSFNSMFRNANSYNQPMNWNFNTATMSYMFSNTSAFNQDLSNWNTSAITNMAGIFSEALAFNQDLSGWNLQSLSSNGLSSALSNSAISCENYSNTLIGWSSNANTPSGISLGATNIQYGTNAVAARSNLVSSKNWVITGDINSNTDCSNASLSINPFDIETPQISIFPNPAIDYFYLNLSGLGNVSIYSTDGKLVESVNLSTHNQIIEVNDYPKGVYLVRFMGNDGVINQTKFIKE